MPRPDPALPRLQGGEDTEGRHLRRGWVTRGGRGGGEGSRMPGRGGHTRSACMAFIACSAILASSLPKNAPPNAPSRQQRLRTPHPALRLRGAGPKKKPDLFKTSFAPGSLPEWAQDIIDYRNTTTPIQRVRDMRATLERPDSSDLEESDSDATTSHDCVWGGLEEGWIDVRKSEADPMDDGDDGDGIESSGEFKSVRKRREWVRALKDLHGDTWDPEMLKMGGTIQSMWFPDEPVFLNVSQRMEKPMALHKEVIHPDRGDPNFLLREAAKLGEAYEVERQVLVGADINGTDPQFSDWTALHYAAWNNHNTTCEMLIKLGAYKFPLDHAGWTPWDCATMMEHWDLAELLEKLGASPPIKMTMLPDNFEGAEHKPFTCTNEYFNPNFTETEVFKMFSLNWIEDLHHPVPKPLGPPVVPTEWFGTYNPRPNLTDDADVMRDNGEDPYEVFRDQRERDMMEGIKARKAKETATEKEKEEKLEVEEWEPPRDDIGRIFLTCPFADKDACKALGGRWDMERKRWFVPSNKDAKPFAKWWPPKPLNWKAPIRIKQKHAFNPIGKPLDSKSYEDSKAGEEEESTGSDDYGMGNFSLECDVPRPEEGQHDNERPKGDWWKHYTNFSERHTNTVVENYEEDKVKKWVESPAGQAWREDFMKRLNELGISNEENSKMDYMDTMDEKEVDEKTKKLIELWEETDETRLQQMQEELEKDRALKREEFLNATKNGGKDPRTAAERVWEGAFEGTHLAVTNGTEEKKQQEGPVQRTLFGAPAKPEPREEPEPSQDSKPANWTEVVKVNDLYDMEIQHINAQKYMAELNKGKLTDKQKGWFWDDPDAPSSGTEEEGLFG